VCEVHLSLMPRQRLESDDRFRLRLRTRRVVNGLVVQLPVELALAIQS
jgi:hypothetical protein